MVPDGVALGTGGLGRTLMLGQSNAESTTILRRLRTTGAALLGPAPDLIAQLIGAELGFVGAIKRTVADPRDQPEGRPKALRWSLTRPSVP